MTSIDPIAPLQLNYRCEVPPGAVRLFRVISALAIVLGVLKIAETAVGFFPYLTGRSHFPAYYPSAGAEFAFNLVPFGLDIFEIVAGAIGISVAGNVRPLIVWAWCDIVGSGCVTAFNGVFVIFHAGTIYQGYLGYGLTYEIATLIYRLAASLTLPIILIMLHREFYVRDQAHLV